jgi:hypothetical protein
MAGMDENPYKAPLAAENNSLTAPTKGVWQWLVRNDMLRVHVTLVGGCVAMAGAAAMHILTEWPTWIAVLVSILSMAAIAEGVWKIDS